MKEDGRTKVDIITKMVESYKSITGCTLDRSNKILVAHVVGLISRAYLRPSSFDILFLPYFTYVFVVLKDLWSF